MMSVEPEKAAGYVVGASVILSALAVAGAICRYLTEYGAGRYGGALLVAALGVGLAVVIAQRLRRHCASPRRLAVVLSIGGVLVAAPLASLVYPGRITYARFGLTVYGLVPIPLMDLTVNSRGQVGFRDKTHWVSLKEVRPLVGKEVEELVIGTGWDDMVQVDPEIRNLAGVRVRALPTPQALELYRQLIAAGKRAVLIAHTTC